MRQIHQQYKQQFFLYWNLHYHSLSNVCINVVSHICIPNTEVGGARIMYVKKFNISI